MAGLLLDTCVLIIAAENRPIRHATRERMDREALGISLISAWELGNLVRKNRLALTMPAATWLRTLADRSGAEFVELALEILAGSCDLPGAPPPDPADRIMIATARDRDMTVVTSDRKILDYAEAGHVRALAC